MKPIEVKIPKEVRQHKETIFFGLSMRQFLCSLAAVAIAAGIYLLLKDTIGEDNASWVCIVAAAPFAVAGFFNYNGMTLEQFLWAVLKSEVLCSGNRLFKAENFHYQALRRKERDDFD